MKLLFDHNISPSLVSRLADHFPGSEHVFNLQLHELTDLQMWSYAREHDFVLVSKDADFAEISIDQGFPPKLLWLRIGNCKTTEIEDLIRSHFNAITELAANSERGILSLFTKSA